MDLNFAEPEIPAEWSPVAPRVGPSDAPGALAAIAESIRSDDLLAGGFEGGTGVERAAAGMEDPRVAAVYASGVPMLCRFLTIELDTEHGGEIGKGIGRVSPRDPPPRFGKKYRKHLRERDAKERMGSIAEDLALRGFAAAAGVEAWHENPPTFPERDLAERWGSLVFNLTPTWHEVSERLQLDADDPSAPAALLMFCTAQSAVENYLALTEEMRLGGRRLFGTARVASYVPFFIAVGVLIFHTGIDKHRGAENL